MAMQIMVCTTKYKPYKSRQPTQRSKRYRMKSLKIDLNHTFDILQLELLPSSGHNEPKKPDPTPELLPLDRSQRAPAR